MIKHENSVQLLSVSNFMIVWSEEKFCENCGIICSETTMIFERILLFYSIEQ